MGILNMVQVSFATEGDSAGGGSYRLLRTEEACAPTLRWLTILVHLVE